MVASGKWETCATASGQGMSSTGTGKNTAVFLPPHAADKGTAIAVAHDFGNVAARVLAIGQDDAEHPSTGYSSSRIKDATVSEFRFDIPPDQIKEYRLQTRPWDTQVKFANISMNAGENPGAKIEVGAPEPKKESR
jgi:hypothetical protein